MAMKPCNQVLKCSRCHKVLTLLEGRKYHLVHPTEKQGTGIYVMLIDDKPQQMNICSMCEDGSKIIIDVFTQEHEDLERVVKREKQQSEDRIVWGLFLSEVSSSLP